MKIRIKFAKTGSMKFVGHLDVMRFFQKLMRRADVDIAYSEGFSPHQIMSFAAPLGLGLTSKGEYLDIEVNSTDSSKEMIKRLNEHSVDGIKIISYRLLDYSVQNAMSSVAAAAYILCFRDGCKPASNLKRIFDDFMNQETINVVKQTKKSEVLMDIKPLIYENYVVGNEQILLILAAGSENNLKPELVMKAFSEFIGFELGQFDLIIERAELYGKKDDELIPLMDFGTDIV